MTRRGAVRGSVDAMALAVDGLQTDPRATTAGQPAVSTTKVAQDSTPTQKLPQSGAESELEMILANRIAIAGLPAPERQFRFCETRRWRADFAYPGAMLLIEVDGGAFVGGRHTRGAGFEADCEKASTAAALGFRVIRVTGRMVKDGRAVALIRQALEA